MAATEAQARGSGPLFARCQNGADRWVLMGHEVWLPFLGASDPAHPWGSHLQPSPLHRLPDPDSPTPGGLLGTSTSACPSPQLFPFPSGGP